MTSEHDKPKRWRPRFSVRTLVIVVTLVCCYAACWGPTKKQGVDDVVEFTLSKALNAARTDNPHLAMYDVAVPMPSAAMPLVVVVDGVTGTRRRYYFWFFGYVAKLPYERESASVELPPPPVLFRDLKSVSPNPTIPIERGI